jgi:hypothetical protein
VAVPAPFLRHRPPGVFDLRQQPIQLQYLQPPAIVVGHVHHLGLTLSVMTPEPMIRLGSHGRRTPLLREHAVRLVGGNY